MQKCTNIKCNSNNPNFKVMRLEKPIKAGVDPELSKGGEATFAKCASFLGGSGGVLPQKFLKI